jgi:uncharacterized membrane protein
LHWPLFVLQSGENQTMTLNKPEATINFLRLELEKLSEPELAILERIIKRERVVRNVTHEYDEGLSFGERMSDRFAAIMGSWKFIIIQSTILAIWVLLNITAFIQHWDPYPFILLNLALSFQAAYAAPIIMMSQNRQADKDRLQSKNDYEVDMKAEMEILQLNEKFNELRDSYWADLLRIQQQQIEMLHQITNEIRANN